MNILILGGGGREHALAWKAAQSAQIKQVFVAPGNAGTQAEPNVTNVNIQPTDIPALTTFAQHHQVGLTIVGPETPLAVGIVDAFLKAHVNCFGPTQAAAQLETSKTFCKDFLQRHHIPTAHYASFTDPEKAKEYIKKQGTPIVIKADGLAAGKGVIIALTEKEALHAVDNMLSGNQFGKAGHRIVIEAFLQGEEVSFIVMVDGEHILPLATSQDHKRRDNGDRGPNTGGMGAYSPAPMMTSFLHEKIMAEVIQPAVMGMKAEGHAYVGFLYAGLMITKNNEINVLEFNCRLGDPETQPMMMRLHSDLPMLCLAALEQRLHQTKANWDKRVALGVVLAAGGYPNHYRQGDVISSLPPNKDNYKIFHAGTRLENGQLVTAGGRVLCVTALGNTIAEAQTIAYQLAHTIKWPNVHYRTDIGYRAAVDY